MAKRRRKQQKKAVNRQTNWSVIGGVVLVGVLILAGLYYFASRNSEGVDEVTLTSYCEGNPENCVFSGGEETAVTIVEVSDYGCSHCKAFHEQTLPALKQQYIDNEQVRWITVPFALSSERIAATNAAMCANEQGAFAAMGELLFAQQGTALAFTQEGYMAAANELQLDMMAFSSCVDNGRYDDTIRRNIRVANGVGVNSTPTFFINGRKISGAQPLSVFQQQIEAALNLN